MARGPQSARTSLRHAKAPGSYMRSFLIGWSIICYATSESHLGRYYAFRWPRGRIQSDLHRIHFPGMTSPNVSISELVGLSALMCAAHCQVNQNCVGFNFRLDASGSSHCDMKRHYLRWAEELIEDPDGEYYQKPGSQCRTAGNGFEYAGTDYRTISGLTCQRWDQQSPHLHDYDDPTRYAGDITHVSQAENYCRNPDGEVDGPWCYTVSVDNRWETCHIPFCNEFWLTDADIVLNTTSGTPNFNAALLTDRSSTSCQSLDFITTEGLQFKIDIPADDVTEITLEFVVKDLECGYFISCFGFASELSANEFAAAWIPCAFFIQTPRYQQYSRCVYQCAGGYGLWRHLLVSVASLVNKDTAELCELHVHEGIYE